MWPMFTENIGVFHISHQNYHGNETMSTVSIHLFILSSFEYFASTYCVLVGLGGQLRLFQGLSLPLHRLKMVRTGKMFTKPRRAQNLYQSFCESAWEISFLFPCTDSLAHCSPIKVIFIIPMYRLGLSVDMRKQLASGYLCLMHVWG